MNIHDERLDTLMFRLDEIDEEPRYIEWVMKGPIWTPEYKNGMECMCDLILGYRAGPHVVPVELKRNIKGRKKAVHQIRMGKKFAEDCLDIPAPYGKFVTYGQKNYRWERINLE